MGALLLKTFRYGVLPLVGVAAIVTMFILGYADDVPVRMVFALAGAAVACALPGMLNLDAPYGLRVSGALGVFVIIMFAEDARRYVFDRSPSAPHVPKTVSISRSQLLYQSEIASAQFEFSHGNDITALEILEKARARHPDDPLALHMTGSIYFKLGRYSDAARAFAAGYEQGGSGAGRFAYNAALSYDAMHSPPTKLWINKALDFQSRHRNDYPTLWRDIVHFRGLTYALEGLSQSVDQRREAFGEAFKSFQQFRDADGRPVLWADYNLACMHATNAALSEPPSTHHDETVEHFARFLAGLQWLSTDLLKGSLDVAKKVLLGHPRQLAQRLRGPGESKECPAIKKAWGAANRTWDEVRKAIAEAEKRAPRTQEDQGRQSPTGKEGLEQASR